MATETTSSGRQRASPPKFKGRENSKNILCRNVTIYGYCKHEQDGALQINIKHAWGGTKLSQKAACIITTPLGELVCRGICKCCVFHA